MLNFTKEKPRTKNRVRKLVKGNFQDGEKPYLFEIGKRVGEHGIISAIIFREHYLIDHGKVYHEVYIQKENGEEMKWKGVFEDRIIEFDVS